MTTVNNAHASSLWLLTVGPLAHIAAPSLASPFSSLHHFTLFYTYIILSLIRGANGFDAHFFYQSSISLQNK